MAGISRDLVQGSDYSSELHSPVTVARVQELCSCHQLDVKVWNRPSRLNLNICISNIEFTHGSWLLISALINGNKKGNCRPRIHWIYKRRLPARGPASASPLVYALLYFDLTNPSGQSQSNAQGCTNLSKRSMLKYW